MLVAFGGKMETAFLLGVILNGIIIKTLIEAVCLPITYWCCQKLKRLEGFDYFDEHPDTLFAKKSDL